MFLAFKFVGKKKKKMKFTFVYHIYLTIKSNLTKTIRYV